MIIIVKKNYFLFLLNICSSFLFIFSYIFEKCERISKIDLPFVYTLFIHVINLQVQNSLGEQKKRIFATDFFFLDLVD